MTVMFRPMGDTTWKRPADRRRPSQFTADWTDTLKLLAREVELLGGEDITIELEVLPAAIRLDGLGLKSKQQPVSPAVVVTFETEHGVLVYKNDALDSPTWRNTAGWRHNVRGIALTLERLRDIERYGASDQGQQYAGYAALPAGSGAVALGGMTHDQALSILTNNAQGAGPTDGFSLEQLYRRAKARTHPDRHNGSQSLWDETEQAARVLGIGS